MELFEVSWRRTGFGDSDDELQFREQGGRGAHALLGARPRRRESEPVWFERCFAFKLGPHLLRGRVDRVDRHPDGTLRADRLQDRQGRRPSSELREDVQLSLYQMGARESWELETSAQSYYYVLDNEKVPVEHSEEELERVRATVADDRRRHPHAGVRADARRRTICRFCDYRIICPAAEK